MPYNYDDYERYDFYDPGGRSALRAGKREYPCPTCNEPDRLTAKDVKIGYQCDACADGLEGYFSDLRTINPTPTGPALACPEGD